MILPVECDDAVERLQWAITELGETGAPMFLIDAYVEAHRLTSDALRRAAEWGRVEDVEERHIDAQICPWVDDE